MGQAVDVSDNPYLIAIDAGGALHWAVSGLYHPKIATADGGVIATAEDGTPVIFDQTGSVTGQLVALPVQSWGGETYSLAGSSVTETVRVPVQWAYSFQPAAGGNPSGSGTSVPFLGWRWLKSLFGFGRGPRCQLGSSKVPLGGEVLQKYNDLKQALLNGGYLTCPACSEYFNENTQRGQYFSQLTSAVTNQVPSDGTQSNINMYDAGLWTTVDTTNPRFPYQWMETPVCSNFQDIPDRINIAMAQVQQPATDVYINTKRSVVNRYLRQSTILHEALHNRTGLGDPQLASLLGVTLTVGGGTDAISKALETRGCAATSGN